MKNILTVLTNLLVLFISSSCMGQISDPNDMKLSEKQISEEYALVYNSLINYHPEPYMYIDSVSLRKYVTERKSVFTSSMSIKDLHIEIRKLIAQIKCGHTYARPSAEWYRAIRENLSLLPFDLDIKNNRAYVKNITEDPLDFDVGDEVLSINKLSIEEMLNQMRSIQERDGHIQGFVESKIERSFRSYYLFLYGMPDEMRIKYVSDGQTQETKVKLSGSPLKKTKPFDLAPSFEVQLENDWSTFAIQNDNKTAYLKIKSVSDRKEYKDYYASVFEMIKEKNIERLILDLRDNGGGFFGHGNTLLTYLCKEEFDYNFRRSKKKIESNKYIQRNFISRLTKFAFSLKPKKNKMKDYKQYTFSYKPDENYFSGKLDVLINGGSFSQASLISAKLHAEGATFYGSETGGTESGTNAVLNSRLSLPHSGIQVIIPYYRVVTGSPYAEVGRGVLPDVELPDMESKSNTDTQLEYLLSH
jgi:hypothetical protein